MALIPSTWTTSRTAVFNKKMKLLFMVWSSVIFVCNIPHCLSLCSGLNVTVSTFPQGDINVKYPGQPLEIFCTAANNYTYKDVMFRLNGDEVASEYFNDTTIRLYIEQPQPQRHIYYCTNKKTHKHCLNKVLVEGPPPNVTDFKCISRNLESLNCSWTYPITNTNINYELSFFVNSVDLTSFDVMSIGNTRYCVWSTYSQPMYRQLMRTYVFSLISRNVFGIRKQNFTVDHFSIVKPDKPMNLTILEAKQHNALLYWELPLNIFDLLQCDIEHKIEYQIKKHSSFIQADATSLNIKKKNYTFNLIGLPYAHMRYEVRIYIKPKTASNEFWSEPAYTFFDTTAEIPDNPPDMAPGAFAISSYKDHREINVYWKQLQEYEENGASFTYQVMVRQDGNTQTLFPDKKKSLSYVVIRSASLNSIHVEVCSSNDVGLSRNSSYLYIPAESNMLKGPTSFTKLAFENGSYELSWDKMNSNYIDNYTLFWCQYNYTYICVGRLNFKTLVPHKNSHIIQLPIDKRYQFAIAVNRGAYTSGMVWATCELSRYGVAMYAFQVTFEYGVPGKTHVKLSWSLGCKLREDIITGYYIKYCPVINDTILCDSNVKNESLYINDPKLMDINVTNLLPFRTYKFDLSLNTTYGIKVTNKTIYVTTSEDAPSEPTNVTIYDIRNDSIAISWDSPRRRNGNIVRYLIYNYGVEMYKDSRYNLTDKSRRHVKLTGLHGFTNYSLSVVACNGVNDMSLCSKRNASEEIFVRTRLGPPSRLPAPKLESNPDNMRWEKPEYPAGPVNLYQIKRVRDQKLVDIYNTTELEMSLLFCEGVSAIETIQVRAVNFDDHPNHGAYAETNNVLLPKAENNGSNMYAGEWSDESTYACKISNTFVMVLIFMVLFVSLMGMAFASIKMYNKIMKMKDLNVILPDGLDLSKDATAHMHHWSGSGIIDKTPSSDVALLLPNKKSSQNCTIKEEIIGSNDRTESTILSQASLEPQDQETISSDEASTSSLNIDSDPNKLSDDQENEESSSSDLEISNNSPSGFIQPTQLSGGNVQSILLPQLPPPAISKSIPLKPVCQPTTSSYVMASLPLAPIFSTSVSVPKVKPLPTSGYVQPDDMQLQHKSMNFPTIGPSAMTPSPESLPSMPILPASKCGDRNYIQLQSLEPSHTSLKPAIGNTVPSKTPASNGYVSPPDLVMNKHLNILSGAEISDESPILDRTMSPDAYCRFSWSTDPSTDNLRAFLRDADTTSALNH